MVKLSVGSMASACAAHGARVSVCPHASDGMGASLAWGVRGAAVASGWIIALADMPWIKSATIEELVSALEGRADIVAPLCHGTRGHPVGFSRRHYAALAALESDEGERALILANRATLELRATDDAGMLRDIDTPSQLEVP